MKGPRKKVRSKRSTKQESSKKKSSKILLRSVKKTRKKEENIRLDKIIEMQLEKVFFDQPLPEIMKRRIKIHGMVKSWTNSTSANHMIIQIEELTLNFAKEGHHPKQVLTTILLAMDQTNAKNSHLAEKYLTGTLRVLMALPSKSKKNAIN